MLRAVALQNGTNDACTESKVFKLRISFAAQRIKEEGNCLRREVQYCLRKINIQQVDSGLLDPYIYQY